MVRVFPTIGQPSHAIANLHCALFESSPSTPELGLTAIGLFISLGLLPIAPASAQSFGGVGGSGFLNNKFGITPGVGGTGGGFGIQGGNATNLGGGGGGGAGAAGGANGGFNGADIQAGGAGGISGSFSAPGGGGGGGGIFTGDGGTGGGGGGNGALITTGGSFTTTTPFSGGAGGVGGSDLGGSGGGGSGGYGVAATGSSPTDLTLNLGAGAIRGGDGGAGGAAFFLAGGSGGDGGVGVYLATPGSSLTLSSGTVSGGNGAVGGASGTDGATYAYGRGGNGGTGVLGVGLTIKNSGTILGGTGAPTVVNTGKAPGTAAPGLGGVGISGSDLTISNSGTISGGYANGGAGSQNYAIRFTGGTNYVGTGGVINGGISIAGGSFQPQLHTNPVGATLAVNGPILFAPGTFYNVRITPTANDSVTTTGVATLNGAGVNVIAGNGTYKARQYTILTAAGGVVGTFSTVASNLVFLTPSLSYDANNVLLNIAPTNPTPAGTPDYRPAAITYNQIAVASGLTQAGSQNGGKGPILNALNQLTAPQARAAFDALSGEGITAAQNIANRSAELFTSSIFDQTTFYSSAPSANSVTLFDPAPIRELADLPSHRAEPTMPVAPNRTWRAWATGYGGVDDIHGNSQIGSSYQQNTIYGGTLGVDYQLLPNYLIGVAVAGTNGDFLVPGRATSGSTTGGHVAFYDLATFGSFYGASSTSFSYFGNRAKRTVSGFGGLGTETERANFNSNEFRTRLEFGRHLAGYGGVLTPFVALELAELRSNGFTENAVQGPGLFRLNVSGQSQASAPAFVGVRLQRATSIGNGITLSPTLQVAYVHEFAPYRSQIGTIADLPGSTFLVDGARPARNAAQVKAGAEMAIGARSVIFANFDGEFSRVNQLYAGKGGFRYLW